MFSEESIRRARKRVYGAESVLEEILSISSQQSVFGKWTLQGQLPNGGFKAISNSSPYSIFFILSRTEIDPDAQLDEEVASLVNMIVHYQLSLIHKSAHFYALLEVPFHLKTKDISRRLMWITDFKQLTPLPVFLRQRSSQAAWCWSFLFQVLIDVAETLQILHEDLCISCG